MCLVLPPHCPPQVIVIDPSTPTTRALVIPGPTLRIGPTVVCTSAGNVLHTYVRAHRLSAFGCYLLCCMLLVALCTVHISYKAYVFGALQWGLDMQ